MAIVYTDLWTAWPTCGLCGSQFFSWENPPYQLDCLHLFCQVCLNDTWQGSWYQCPFCWAPSGQASFNGDLINAMGEITQQGYQLATQQIAGHYYWFKNRVNTTNVPCRNMFVARCCNARNCLHSHDPSSWQQYNCPQWDSCTRGHFCPYKHSWSVDVYQTLTNSTTYTASAAVALQQAPEVPDLVTAMSTVQAYNYQLQKGQTIIRSRSLLNYLLANECCALMTAANMHQAQISAICPSQVRYTATVKWMYYKDDRECFYNEYMSQQLEQGKARGEDDVRVSQDIRVNLKLMIQVSPNNCLPVLRQETLISSTVAGTIDTLIQADQYEAFYATLVMYEVSVPLSNYANCPNLKAVAEKYGLGVVQGSLYGLEADLQQAGMELQASYSLLLTPVQCMALHPGVDSVTAQNLCQQLNLAIYDTRVFGRAEDLINFQGSVQRTFQSIPVPTGLSDGRVQQLCAQYGVKSGNGSLYGTRDKIAMVLGGMAENQVPIPPGTPADKIAAVVNKYRLRQEGNTLFGSREDIMAAMQELQNQEVSATFPNQLLAPQVQTVCAKHGVRMEGDKVVGVQAGVLAAINELNTNLPKQMAFQYHKPPAWYLRNAEELKLVDLPANDPEYVAIAAQFHQTTPNNITKIRVVQNKRLYTNFAFKHEGYSQIEGKAVAIQRLFHGTRANAPEVIYKSDAGLDSRLGGGMWGNGTYYALNSSYSVNYAHPAADGTKEMFLCEVLVGDFIQLPSDGTLKKPPAKPNSTQCYHSVKGNTGGSDIWITYEPAMSYPHFLINYQ